MKITFVGRPNIAGFLGPITNFNGELIDIKAGDFYVQYKTIGSSNVEKYAIKIVEINGAYYAEYCDKVVHRVYNNKEGKLNEWLKHFTYATPDIIEKYNKYIHENNS